MTGYFELICSALPSGVSPSLLRECAPASLWRKNPDLATKYALRKCKRLNWEAYLRQNEDVRASGVDPIWHFLKDGVFEGRRLIVHREPTTAPECDEPKVSIIIANYNNSLYLEKCLRSALGQTLLDIEVLVVDDASTDRSWDIITRYAKSDGRVVPIRLQENGGQHAAQMNGVQLARGRYAMFLDADDFLADNACEIAFAEIEKGYDIVCFNSHIINHTHMCHRDLATIDRYLNCLEDEIYDGYNILKATFEEHKLNFTLWNKIYEMSLCKCSYEEMDICHLVNHDLYAFFVMATKARSMKRITEKLIYYNCGIGMSTPSAEEVKLRNFFTMGDIFPHLSNFCSRYGNSHYIKSIREDLLKHEFKAWLEIVPVHSLRHYFNIIVMQYGLKYILHFLIRNYFYKWQIIAQKYACFYEPVQSRGKRIGIFLSSFRYGGVATVVAHDCELLLQHGYDVYLLLEDRMEEAPPLNSKVKLLFIRDSTEYRESNIVSHVDSLIDIITTNPIDLVLYEAGSSPVLLWDILALHQMHIPVIVRLHECFTHVLTEVYHRYTLSARDLVYKCADKVICLSTYAELYFRSRGIDAQYLPNPNPDSCAFNRVYHSYPTIAVVARLDDPIKQIHDCLYILAEVKKIIPEIRMLFVGEFYDIKNKCEFDTILTDMNLCSNVTVTGWTRCPLNFLVQSDVLLSTSYSEGYPMNLSEAHAIGIPCVYYDIPVMMSKYKYGISKVLQNDISGAAEAIIAIISDKKSQILRDNDSSVSNVQHRDLINVLKNFAHKSTLSTYGHNDFVGILDIMAEHATRGKNTFLALLDGK